MLKKISQILGSPVSVSEVKRRIPIDDHIKDYDKSINGYIIAAIAHLDGSTGILGRAVTRSKYLYKIDKFTNKIRLPLGRDVDNINIKYYDRDNKLKDFTDFKLIEDDINSWLHFHNTPQIYTRPACIQIEYMTGYTVTTFPEPLKIAVCALVIHWFDGDRGDKKGSNQTPESFKSLVTPFVRVGL